MRVCRISTLVLLELNLVVKGIHSIQTIILAGMSRGLWMVKWHCFFDVFIIALNISPIKHVKFLVNHLYLSFLSVFEKFNVLNCTLASDSAAICRVITL